MHFSQSKLHNRVLQTDEQMEKARHQASLLKQKRQALVHEYETPSATTEGTISLTLTAVTMAGNFDAYINIQFQGAVPGTEIQILVDTGNSMLIIPYWETIQDLPGYTVLGQANEPWGCPANVVKGPILFPTASGSVHTISDCVFYACTGNNQQNERTGNFGAGRIQPWSASGWNTPLEGVTMQAPLSYDTGRPFAEFIYNPSFADDHSLIVSDDSILNLYATAQFPSGYTMMKILPHVEWMSLIPESLSIGNTVTGWPGNVSSPIAMIDLGGGPVFLSDPNGYIYNKTWPDNVSCPMWANGSTNCNCVSGAFVIGLGDGIVSYSYTIDTSTLPVSVQGLTGVFCEVNSFMMGQQGMNAGGISALFNDTLVDYGGNIVGLKLKATVGTDVPSGA